MKENNIESGGLPAGENLQDQGREWEELIQQTKIELEGLTPDEAIEKYIEVMAQKNAMQQRSFTGEKVSDADFKSLQDRALVLASLMNDVQGSRSFTPEEVIGRIQKRKEEILK